MPSEDPRAELADLARLLGAHLDWQRELGVSTLAFDPSSFGTPPAGGAAVPMSPAASSSPSPRIAKAFAPAALPPATAPVEARPVVRTPIARVVPVAPPPAARMPLLAVEPPVAAVALRPVFEGAPLEGEARTDALSVLRDEVAGCTACRLHVKRKQTVFARGNPFAPLVFIGEAPGANEDATGMPFVGEAGQLLDKIIGAMGLGPDEFYVCNVVKCRPPENRVPEPAEMSACGPFLQRQLGFVRPRVIVALGKTAAQHLLGSRSAMKDLRGRWHTWNGVDLLATWHPAYLLRLPSAKRETWDDMKLVLQRLGRSAPRRP